jgi:hypothetical protein
LLPYLLTALFLPLGGKLADSLRRQQKLTNNQVRKCFICSGLGILALAILLVAVGTATDNLSLSLLPMIFIILGSSFFLSGIHCLIISSLRTKYNLLNPRLFHISLHFILEMLAFLTNHLEICPKYCGTLMGISSTIGVLSSYLCQFFIEFMTKDKVGFYKKNVL